MYKLLFLIISISLAALLHGCRKECKPRNKTNYLKDADKSKIPYTGFQSIKLLRKATGDTVVFFCDNWEDGWWLEQIGNADQCIDELTQQVRQLTFYSNTVPEKIILSIYCQGAGGGRSFAIIFYANNL